jgi:glycosyltransferase involved in cell wall biosynthesis
MVIAQIITDNREPFRQYDRPTPWFGTAPEALLQGFASLPEVKVHVIGCTQKPMVSSPEKLAGNIWFHSLVVPKLGWMRTGYQGCIRAVRRKVRELNPDIVHGQGTERECSLSAVFSGYPNVLTIHGNMRLVAEINGAGALSFYGLAARLEAFTLPRSNGVVCITRYTEEAVRPLAKKTWLLPNAVDAAFFSVIPQPDSVPLILCVGAICLRKNQNAFIRALDPLAARLRFDLCFLGLATPGQAYDDEFLSLVAARKWCRHEGFADRPTLKDYFRRAALVVLPSLEDNCPMVVLESMAAGVAVVAARVGGVPDLIEDGRTGRMCDPTNPASMCDTVEAALRDKESTAQTTVAAKREAEGRFHPTNVAGRHLDIYREVIKV